MDESLTFELNSNKSSHFQVIYSSWIHAGYQFNADKSKRSNGKIRQKPWIHEYFLRILQSDGLKLLRPVRKRKERRKTSFKESWQNGCRTEETKRLNIKRPRSERSSVRSNSLKIHLLLINLTKSRLPRCHVTR